ncbi:MAG: hypothetical protein WCO06_00735 [Candidatus Roizmanbacteria bacterium]
MKQTEEYQQDIIMASLKNLRNAMGEKLSFEKFVASSVQSIMMLEREEYLRELTEQGGKDKGGYEPSPLYHHLS